ncbi:MAG: DUF3772 domain-containing protein [Pseudomonas sp.]|nr:DUF3772 domain-containing protein [Pseudomonas sp.]
MFSLLKLLIGVMFILLVTASEVLTAGEQPDLSIANESTSVPLVSQGEMDALQEQLDSLKRQASMARNYNQLVNLQNSVQSLIDDAEEINKRLLPKKTQLQSQLDVLGEAPVAGGASEKPEIAQQRASIAEEKSKVDNYSKMLEAVKENATNLIAQVDSIRRNELESELTLRAGSILNPRFWSPLFFPPLEDQARFKLFMDQAEKAVTATWRPDQRAATVWTLILAVAIWTVGRRLAERVLTWLCIHRITEGRLRRSLLALATTLATVLTASGALQLIFSLFTRQQELPAVLQGFSDEFERLFYICILIAGLSRALLSTKQPSWRLPSIPDQLAQSIRPFSTLVSGLLFILLTLVLIANFAGISVQTTIFVHGVAALIVALVIGALLVRVEKVRSSIIAAGEAPQKGAALAGMIHVSASIAIIFSLFCLVVGYIGLAKFVIYEMAWVYIVFSSVYLLTNVIGDVCDYVFSPASPAGQAIIQKIGIGDVHLEQISIVLSGLGKTVLLLFAVIFLFVGGIGTTLGQLVAGMLTVLGGDWLRKLNIIPGDLLAAVIALFIGVYLIRSFSRWLDTKLLPKTDLDPGMCASLSTLFSNLGYAVVILMVLSSLGLKWDNLAWIVSALSVGVGFGLQEIVKNFVSGLILLTERPVKVGDLVSISGVEGDIRRINVRATEIQLSDGSIVIVPNSQLISQNLRNVTLGGSAKGVATLEMIFPLDIDPEQVRSLLYEACSEHETILDRPPPSVRFSKMTPDGLTVTITGYVNSPRVVSLTKSELLFDIVKRLRAAGITLGESERSPETEVPPKG